MKLIKWEHLPPEMQNDAVQKYYGILELRKSNLIFKRAFDIVVSVILLMLLFPLFIVLAVLIKLDSKGPVFYRQVRITQYGKEFRIHKFRTMVQDADKGSQVTVNNDDRVTKVGRFIRRYRIDEFPQLLDVIAGDLTLVGVRPESPRYVAEYSEEMMATLLLPAGVTSLASIFYKDEAQLLDNVEDADKVYIEEILPRKMYYNLKGIEQFSFFVDIKILFMTVFAVLGKEYRPNTEEEDIFIERLQN